MGYRTKIDWCDTTWNPVTGCLHGCEYCYARRIANRFKMSSEEMGDRCSKEPDNCRILRSERTGDALVEIDKPFQTQSIKRHDGWKKEPYPAGFNPTLHRYRLDMPEKWSEPRVIFVCSMADLFGEWVPDEWIVEVLNACRKAPQHRYLFLTKNPQRYIDIVKKDIIKGTEENFWLGSTTTRHEAPAFFTQPGPNVKTRCRTFVSIEPMLERFGKCDKTGSVAMTDWVIVGAETGNRKGLVVPERDWILELAEECDKYHKPIFMKESLREMMGADFVQEFPWAF